jgi:hypothetical protein
MREGFLQINVLARLHSRDSLYGMPVIGRADTDSVNVVASQQVAKVTVIVANSAPINLVDLVAIGFASGQHRITDRDNTGIFLGQKCLPMAPIDIACSYQAQGDAFTWFNFSPAAESRTWDNVGKGCSARQTQ